MSDGGSSAAFVNIEGLTSQLHRLYVIRDRLTGAVPMASRGRVVGLPGGPVRQ